MDPQLANMRAAIKKKTEKIAKWQEQKRIMEEKLEKRENTAILGIVREIGMTPEELDGEVVIAQYQNAATIKQFIHDSPDFLVPWNPDPGYKRIPITDEIKPDLRIIGIVRASLLKL